MYDDPLRPLALALALCGLLAPLASAAAGDLVVHVSGFEHARGQAVAKLFAPGDDVLGPGRLEAKAAIQPDGQAVLGFAALPAGDYALVVYHDANANGRIDHNLLGLPQEALGFSNGFRPGLWRGLPSFDKLRFSHPEQAQTLAIQVALP